MFAIFAEQVAALAAEGPDAIFFETFTDIAEVRCGVLAAKSVCDLPVFASCTFGLSGRMDLSGTDPETAAVILEAAGADAVGLNCGLGPGADARRSRAAWSRRRRCRSSCSPTPGLPMLDGDGHTVFPGTPDEMGAFAAAAREAGVAAHRLVLRVDAGLHRRDRRCRRRQGRGRGRRTAAIGDTVLAGPRRIVTLGAGSPVRVIGERINPTGKQALTEALLAGSMSIVRSFAAEQEAAGADLLDVNVGAAGVDAVDDAAAGRARARRHHRRCRSCSTRPTRSHSRPRCASIPAARSSTASTATPSRWRRCCRSPRRYGAAVVVLALDDAGIPADSAGRLAVVERVRDAAHAAGLADADLVVDALVMTAATDADAPRITVAALAAAHDAGTRHHARRVAT